MNLLLEWLFIMVSIETKVSTPQVSSQEELEARLRSSTGVKSYNRMCGFQNSLLDGDDVSIRWRSISVATFYREWPASIDDESPERTFKSGPYTLSYAESAWDIIGNNGKRQVRVKMALSIRLDSGGYLSLSSVFTEDSMGKPCVFLDGSAISEKERSKYSGEEAFSLASSLLTGFTKS